MPRFLAKYDPHYLRGILKRSSETAQQLHAVEQDLIEILAEVDERRIFVYFGYRSLRTYCIRDLSFTRIQAQRIVTQVRRVQTTSDIRIYDAHEATRSDGLSPPDFGRRRSADD